MPPEKIERENREEGGEKREMKEEGKRKMREKGRKKEVGLHATIELAVSSSDVYHNLTRIKHINKGCLFISSSLQK